MGPDLLLCIFSSLSVERKQLQRARWPLTSVHGLRRLAVQTPDCGVSDISSLWATHRGPSNWLHQTRSQYKEMVYEGGCCFPTVLLLIPMSFSLKTSLSLNTQESVPFPGTSFPQKHADWLPHFFWTFTQMSPSFLNVSPKITTSPTSSNPPFCFTSLLSKCHHWKRYQFYRLHFVYCLSCHKCRGFRLFVQLLYPELVEWGLGHKVSLSVNTEWVNKWMSEWMNEWMNEVEEGSHEKEHGNGHPHAILPAYIYPWVHLFWGKSSHEVRDLKLVILKLPCLWISPQRHWGPPEAPLQHFEDIWSQSQWALHLLHFLSLQLLRWDDRAGPSICVN